MYFQFQLMNTTIQLNKPFFQYFMNVEARYKIEAFFCKSNMR